MKTALQQFKVYAPPLLKAEKTNLNKDGSLTITGVASTTNQDLDGEIVSMTALESLREQAVGLNLHLDHNHDYNGGIGTITEAHTEEDKLYITANILPEHATGVRDRLNFGMNMGFSIGGIPIIKNSRSNVIDDFILLEISLTLLPANWESFSTVEIKGVTESNCLTGACHHILKVKKAKASKETTENIEEDETENEVVDENVDDANNNEDDTEVKEKTIKKTNEIETETETEDTKLEEDNKNMSKEKAQNVKATIDDATKQELVNIVNEAIINLKPLILDELKEDMVKLVQEVVATSLGEVMPKALDGMVEEVKASLPTPVTEEEVPLAEKEETEEVVEEVPVEETKAEEEEQAEAEPVEVPADEIIEEEKEVPEKVPLSGIPARKEDVEYANVANANPVTAPTYTIDAKAVADAVIDEVWSKLNFKRVEVPSKLEEYKTTQNITTKSKFLDNDTRDRFGRNKKYL